MIKQTNTSNLKRRSKLHSDIYDAIIEYMPNIRIIEEHNLGNNLFVDIYLPDYDICIEIDGIQHDEIVEFFHGKDGRKFFDQISNDKKKYIKCINDGKFLYRVKYKNLKKTPRDIVIDIFSKWMKYVDERRSIENDNG